MKVWTNSEFAGHYPVGTGAVVVAESAEDAAIFLSIALQERGLPAAQPKDMQELEFRAGSVVILCDGNY